MKRIICILIMFLMLVSFASCKKKAEELSAASDALVTEPEVKPEQQPEQKPETETEPETEQTETPKDETQQEEPEKEPEKEPELTPDQNELEKQKKLEIIKKLNEQTEKELKDYYGEDYVIKNYKQNFDASDFEIDNKNQPFAMKILIEEDYSKIKQQYSIEDFPYLKIEKVKYYIESMPLYENKICLALYSNEIRNESIPYLMELFGEDLKIYHAEPVYMQEITNN